MKRKPSRNEATVRNVRASAKRDAALLTQLRHLESRFEALVDEVAALKLNSGVNELFATAQRRLGYRSSTTAPHQLRVTSD